MGQDEKERAQIEAALDKIAKEFNGIQVGPTMKQEYAALSEIAKASLLAAERAVDASCIKDAKCRNKIISEFGLEIMKLTVRIQEPQPQVVMMAPQGPGLPPHNPFGGIAGIA